MRIPEELSRSIEALVEGIPLSELSRSSKELSGAYRGVKGASGIAMLASERQRLAYLYTRLPATYAVIHKVLSEISGLQIESMADVGAGPGTGMWAAADVFPSLKEVVLYERDPHFIELGKKLSIPLKSFKKTWVQADLEKIEAIAPQDLILASYFLGEIPNTRRENIFLKLWAATQKVLVIIEPGTPKGFEDILRSREFFIEQGAHLIAPCPHARKCPIVKPDWCHFYARVERSSFHRQIKGGTLNFEDEKFSYLILGKERGPEIQGRIVRRPQKNTGFVKLTICSKEGIEQKTITKKTKAEYKAARKADWGDVFN